MSEWSEKRGKNSSSKKVTMNGHNKTQPLQQWNNGHSLDNVSIDKKHFPLPGSSFNLTDSSVVQTGKSNGQPLWVNGNSVLAYK